MSKVTVAERDDSESKSGFRIVLRRWTQRSARLTLTLTTRTLFWIANSSNQTPEVLRRFSATQSRNKRQWEARSQSRLRWSAAQFFVKQHRCRGDTVGALTVALEGAPYGPGVDEAKVISNLVCPLYTFAQVVSIIEPDFAIGGINSEQYQIYRDPQCCQIALSGCARYAHEISVQRDGFTRMGWCER